MIKEMCEYCEKPNKTITRHLIGVSAFVGAGRLLLRFYDKEIDRTIVTGSNIHYCPMCGRNLSEYKEKKVCKNYEEKEDLKEYENED